MTSHMPIVYLHGEHMFLFLFTVLGCSFTSPEITHIKTNTYLTLTPNGQSFLSMDEKF